jgi:hypothetical protein
MERWFGVIREKVPQMKIILFCMSISLTLFNCKSVKLYQSADAESIYGNWSLRTNTPALNYPGITFYKDKSAVFSSFGDTIYYFGFELKGGILILVDGKKKLSHNVIAKLSPDSLIFKNLLEHINPQVYIKIK